MAAEKAHKAKQDFIYREYTEASKAYFHGVEIGYTVFKHYVTANTLLGALIGGALGAVGNRALPSSVATVTTVAVAAIIASFFAIVISSALYRVLPLYWSHLQNCANRCVKIESQYGGRLFSEMMQIGKSGRYGPEPALKFMITLVCVFWLLVAAGAALLLLIR